MNSSYNEKFFRLLREKKAHFYVPKLFFQKSCSLCHNVENYGTAGWATDDNMTRSMRCACWITKATDTHSEHVILSVFLWHLMHLNVTLRVHCPSCYTVISPGAITYSEKCTYKYCCIAKMLTLPEKKVLNVFK